LASPTRSPTRVHGRWRQTTYRCSTGETLNTFDADPTQTTKRTNASTGFVEEVEVKGTDWTWFVREGSQALFELSRAVKDGGGGPGSPWPGDQISAKLVGFKPSPKGPDPMQVIEVGFTAGSKSRDLVDRDEES
jgi:hypothetical protein